ncbi:RNA polymerase sigma-K factor precursor [compost metagenome]
MEDLISIGTIGLIKAIESCRPNKGTKLAAFAARLDILDEREKEVVVGRFGLDAGGEERTQREIAKALGISRSYVSRIEKRGLMKLFHEFFKAKR